MSLDELRFGRETWRRLIRNISGLLRSGAAKRALLFAGLLVALLATINGLNVLNSYVGRDFMSAIERRDVSGFVLKAWTYVGVFAISTVATVFYSYCEERLGLLWREWQTRQLLERYLRSRAFYYLEERGTLPNPDQRIADDVRSFTTQTMSFALMGLNATFTVIAFSSVLWSISPHLLVVAVIYAAAGSLLTTLLGRKLIGLNDAQLDKEADFRSELLHLRENAESVAVLHREEGVHRRLLGELEEVVANTRRMIHVNRNLRFFTNGYNYLIQIMPALVVAPLFMKGEVEFGVITQSATAFAALMGAFSLVVTQFQTFSSYAAVITRLGKLIEAIDQAERHVAGVEGSGIVIHDTDGRLIYDHLSLRRADGRMLVNDLTVTIERGSRVLVTSSTVHAKLALFKATAGVFVEGQGRIVRPDAGTMLFVPDHPYLPKSSLRELVCDGALGRQSSDAEITQVLTELSLETLLQDPAGFDGPRDWSGSIGMSEQARLMLVGVLLARPQFVFLDRTATALYPAHAEQTLKLLAQRGIGYLVLGRSEDPVDLFDAILSIGADGRWTWRVLDDALNDAVWADM